MQYRHTVVSEVAPLHHEVKGIPTGSDPRSVWRTTKLTRDPQVRPNHRVLVALKLSPMDKAGMTSIDPCGKATSANL